MEPHDLVSELGNRLDELAEISKTLLVREQIEQAKPIIYCAAFMSDQKPGLYLDEDDNLEARWLVPRDAVLEAQVINVTFGSKIDLYVFDRKTNKIILEMTIGLTGHYAGIIIADIVNRFKVRCYSVL